MVSRAGESGGAVRLDGAVVLLNGLAGKGSARLKHEAVREEAAAAGIEVRGAASPEEMEQCARQAAASGIERVIAAGGDGTVHHVLNGIAGSGALLGIIPCGSGNDLAVNLGIPRDVRAAARFAFTGETRDIDLCRVECGGHSRFYGCIASFGLDSHANRIANLHRGPFRGTALYVWSLLRALAEFTPVDVRVTHDAGEYRAEILLLVAANASSYGGGMRIAPGADLADGRLDLVAVRRMTRLKLLWCFPEVFSGQHVSREEVTCLCSTEVLVEAARPLQIFADGEYIGQTPARVSVLPAALRVIAGPCHCGTVDLMAMANYSCGRKGDWAYTGAGGVELMWSVSSGRSAIKWLVAASLTLRVLAMPANGQAIINTVAGTGGSFPSNVTVALNAPLGRMVSVAVDTQGNTYAADLTNDIVIQVAPTGSFRIVAGNGISGFSGDGGPATAASLHIGSSVSQSQGGIAVDAAGNVYITDTFSSRIRMVSTSGVITTVAGSGTAGFSGDGGPATSAQLFYPQGVAVDTSGNLFIIDNGRIRKVTAATGVINTIAGNGTQANSGDGGPALAASLLNPSGIAVNASGDLFIAANNVIRKVSAATGVITTYAGNGTQSFSGDGGPATSAMMSRPLGMAVNASGNLYIADSGNNRIRKVTSNGVISTVAGSGSTSVGETNGGFSGDGGQATNALLNQPSGVAVDSSGNLFIADSGGTYFSEAYGNYRIRQVAANGVITTIAGNGNPRSSGDTGPATAALLYLPFGVAADASGDLFIADTANYRIRKVSASGVITTVAGNGIYGSSGDGGPATSASLRSSNGVAVDSNGNLFIAETLSNRIRKVSPSGVITTVAGNGNLGYFGDGGQATQAYLFEPGGVAVDTSGNLFIADSLNQVIRRVSSGVITTVAGKYGAGNAFAGDGGPATAAGLNYPKGVAVDASGNLYIADWVNHRIRKVTAATGIISTVAGNGTPGFSGDGGPATSASLFYPEGVAVDASGNLFIADSSNSRIRKVSAAGVITTFAGPGGVLSAEGGPATPANLALPTGVALDTVGDLFIADPDNNRILEVTSSSATTVSATPGSLTFTVTQGTSPAAQSLQITGTSGVSWQASATTASGGTWLSASPGAGQIPASLTVIINSTNMTLGTYQGSITIQAPGASASVTVTLTITASPAGQLTVTPASLSVQTQAGTNPAAQAITIGNTGGGTLNWTATAITVNGGNWLSISPASGSPTLLAPSQAALSFSATGLQAGLYTGQVTISPGPLTVIVQLLVTPAGAALVLGQTGILFNSVPGGSPPAQSVSVFNSGSGILSWSASVGNGSWLSVSPGTGSSVGGVLSVSANTTGLSTGSYYGLLQVSAPGAANSPRYISVVLNLLSSTAPAYGTVSPRALIFVAAGGAAPAAQTVNIFSGSLAAVTANVVTATQSGGTWLSATPATQSLMPGGAATVSVAPGTLAAGVYQGTVTAAFGNGAPSQDIAVYLVVPPASALQPAAIRSVGAASCTATSLVMAVRQLGNNFSSPVGWPVDLEAQVVDSCGNPAMSATVVASFSNGDVPLALANLGSGIYSATWKPGNLAATTTVTLQAFQSPLAPATVTLTGQVGANTAPPPFVGQGGVVNGASFAAGADIAPGAIVSVFGTNLAASDGNHAPGFPLPTTLAGIKLTIGGIDAPLFYAGTGQVNAQVPFEMVPGSQPQVVARAFSAAGVEADAVPEPISIGTAHPGIFLAAEAGAPKQGAILNAANVLVDAANPATAGSVLVIFATGLGATTPASATGQAAAAGSVNTPVAVTIGGAAVPSANIQYAGPAPTYVGLYQVNVALPAGTATGPAVPVVILQNGVASNTATIAVH